jgi:superfamily II DNA helicase RecQ
MSLHFFCIPAQTPRFAEADLNSFCAANAVVSLDRNLIECGVKSYWSVCVTVRDHPGKLPKGSGGSPPNSAGNAAKVDYREVLSDLDFALYSHLREFRKALANEHNLPLYGVASNEQLAQMAITRPNTLEALGKVEGMGEVRLQKFGKAILDALVGVTSP